VGRIRGGRGLALTGECPSAARRQEEASKEKSMAPPRKVVVSSERRTIVIEVQDPRFADLLEQEYEKKKNKPRRVQLQIEAFKEGKPEFEFDGNDLFTIRDNVLHDTVNETLEGRGKVRLLLDLPLSPGPVKGNPNSMCPCDLEP
jgi:hypothetical protein